jgi:hypothetical protein
LYVSAGGVWLSGVVWLALHWWPRRPDVFGLTRHPVEPWTLIAHAAFGVVVTWLFGLLWGTHVRLGWLLRQRRTSGVIVIAVLIALVLSGFVLYYVGDERARTATSLFHWIVGLVALPILITHRRAQQIAP